MISDNMSDFNVYNITVLNQTWQKRSSFSYENKIRPYYGLCFIVSGEIKYKTDKEEISAEKGDIIVLKKSARYKALFNSNFTHNILINFLCDKDDTNDEKIIVLKNRVDLQKKFFDALNYDLSGRKCMVKSIIFKIIDELCEKNNDYVKNIIDDNFKISEEEIAKKCSVSISTLQRNFKKTYGKTISEYKNELKILKAKELLNTGKYSMEEIAELSGFCDSSYFSKCFKKSVGISPKNYLKQCHTM